MLLRIQWYGVKSRLLGNVIRGKQCRVWLYYNTEWSVEQEAQSSSWIALQLWQKAPGNTEMHWPVLWVQLEGTVLALVFARSPNMTVKKGFPHAKPKISCVWQSAKLFIWVQTEISEAWSAAFVTSAYRSRSMEGTWGWAKPERKVIQYLLWGK